MGMSTSAQGGDDDNGYRPMAEINITPMVDVMLVLLIIFMVAAPLMVQGVPVDLPKSSAAKLEQIRKPTIVSLTSDRRLEIRGGDVAETVERGNLVQRLMAMRGDIGNSVVYVRADRSIPYGEVMELLGRVGEAGYHRVSLLSQPAPSQAAATPASGK